MPPRCLLKVLTLVASCAGAILRSTLLHKNVSYVAINQRSRIQLPPYQMKWIFFDGYVIRECSRIRFSWKKCIIVLYLDSLKQSALLAEYSRECFVSNWIIYEFDFVHCKHSICLNNRLTIINSIFIYFYASREFFIAEDFNFNEVPI